MKCPKCGKLLKVVSLSGEKWFTHTYSLSHALTNKPMCDYSKQVKEMDKYTGNDNDGNPKSFYLDSLLRMTDEQLRSECSKMIWLSAYANNNPRSDYHWQCDACYDECKSRTRPDIYSEEHAKLTKEARGY